MISYPPWKKKALSSFTERRRRRRPRRPSRPVGGFLGRLLRRALRRGAAFFSSLDIFFSKSASTPGPVDLATGAAGGRRPRRTPRRRPRGLELGGASPGAKRSGRRAAVPCPPPAHPSIGPSHSIPSLVTPPTGARFTFSPSRSSAPTHATTTRMPTVREPTFPAFVTIVRGSGPPTSTRSFLSLSFFGTSSHSRTSPVLNSDARSSAIAPRA